MQHWSSIKRYAPWYFLALNLSEWRSLLIKSPSYLCRCRFPQKGAGSTVDSRYLDYSLSRTFRYLELFSRSLGHFAVTQAKILSISRTSISRTFRYLEQYFRSPDRFSLVISNFSPNFQKFWARFSHFRMFW